MIGPSLLYLYLFFNLVFITFYFTKMSLFFLLNTRIIVYFTDKQTKKKKRFSSTFLILKC